MNNKFKKYLGIDWGEVRIGLAIGDSENKIATPFGVVGDIKEISAVIKNEEIDEIIVGEPLAMANSKLNNKEKYLDFIKELKEKFFIPVFAIDERLTSQAADALLGDKKSKAPRDAIAAMLILQSFFDRKA
ncbi:MAG: Holliday junction resolvase RuvX [Candidatus Falkowbacteria bacterium]|nr:Holliday junction resolvase RuvX [Candidatus Falkowbacteria bacterium]